MTNVIDCTEEIMKSNYYKPRIKGTNVEVRGDDVGGALRRLRKILEKDNRQKDLAKHEFHEKPSSIRNRAKQAARKRWEREVSNSRQTGLANSGRSTDLSYMKSKRKRRKILDQNARPHKPKA